MASIYQDFLGGELDADLDAGDTTLSSPALAAMIDVADPDTMTVVLDPDGIAGAPEIVTVTAHTIGDATATITRGAEGTEARAHRAGIEWVHTITAAAISSILARLDAGEL